MNSYSILLTAGIIALVLWLRIKRMNKPMRGSGIRLLLPLLFLTLGTLSFTQPGLHLTVLEIVAALGLGAVFAIPLVIYTNYERREDGKIYLKKNNAFIYLLLGFVIIRLALRQYFSSIDPATLSVLLYLVAVSYVVPWRIACFVKYRKVYNELNGQ